MDIDFRVVRLARARLRSEGIDSACIVCDVRRLPLASGSLALVLSLSTLDHFDSNEQIRGSLQEIARALAEDALLLLTLDNPNNPEVALRAWLPPRIVDRLRADDFPLGITMRANAGREMLEWAGLRVEGQTYLIHAPRYPLIRMMGLLDSFMPSFKPVFSERLLAAVELLRILPTRSLTGHYIGWVARKV